MFSSTHSFSFYVVPSIWSTSTLFVAIFNLSIWKSFALIFKYTQRLFRLYIVGNQIFTGQMLWKWKWNCKFMLMFSCIDLQAGSEIAVCNESTFRVWVSWKCNQWKNLIECKAHILFWYTIHVQTIQLTFMDNHIKKYDMEISNVAKYVYIFNQLP